MEWPKVYRVNFAYTFEELEKIMDGANLENQYGCGRYCVSSDWLQIYDRPWPDYNGTTKLLGSCI